MKRYACKRVLMLLENSRYPYDPRVLREATALTEGGYHISIICPGGPGQPWHEMVDGVRVFRFPAPREGNSLGAYLWEYGYSMVAAFFLSLLVFLREGFDVVHAHNPPDTFVLVAAFYKLLGKRFVYDLHDLAPEMYLARFGGPGNRFVYQILLLLEKLSCSLADQVIATNESYKAVEMGRDRVPASRITVVRNGPDLDRFRLTESDPGLRQKGKTIIGYAGVMGFQDGIDHLLRALHHLAYELGRTDFFCVLIGRGDARASLKGLATELDLDRFVWFTGWVSDADYMRYLSTADICVDPDPSNPFNDRSTMNKMAEYMALGKPIVCFDLPEHRFTAQKGALYVRPNDELEFARALAELMDDPERRQTMGSFGCQRVETELAWSHSVPNLLKAYQTLLSGPRQEKVTSSGISSVCESRIRRKISQLKHWLGLRDVRYVIIRFIALVKRYGITSTRAKKRTLECVKFLARYDCRPTFATPGRVVRRNAEFCRELQRLGAEFAVHGHDHVDFRSLSQSEATWQFVRAASAYHNSGIRFEGFRCPYLSYADHLVKAIPNGSYRYSSNRPVWWNVVSSDSIQAATAVFDSLHRLYRAESSESVVVVPKVCGKLLEVPPSLPDDITLHDGLKAGEEGIKQAWNEILHRTHRRGELFVHLFHPETFYHCRLAFDSLLNEARLLRPSIWVTQLQDVSRWWWEKATFVAHISSGARGLIIEFKCSERATILIRNLETTQPNHPWDGSYSVLETCSLHLSNGQRPFVGVSGDIPTHTLSFLKEQAYILDTSPNAPRCGIYLEASTLAKLETDVQLVDYIESSPAPLVRFWRWPQEAKSGLCITGDLDALSLMDYASRLFTI